MASKRENIKLKSSKSHHHYYTTKNKTTTPERLTLQKYDPVVRERVNTKKLNKTNSEFGIRNSEKMDNKTNENRNENFPNSKFRISNFFNFPNSFFELSVACKYLIPRRRQISVSIISLISILVIALVVWLIVVFFSVTDGLEKNWVGKLTSLTAPVRITPTEAYYNSYYYLVDGISDTSGYSNRTIGEKLDAENTDPYDPEFDQEVPSSGRRLTDILTAH